MKSMVSKVRAYLAERRALGFKLESEGRTLMKFARYADARGHRGPLTNKLVVHWACQGKSSDRCYRARRLEIIRPFSRHLLLLEPRTQVPPRSLFGPSHRRQPPHLYSSAQVQQLLRRAEKLPVRNRFARLRPHTWQTLLGLLACSGLRVSEATRLKINDVDWKQRFLIIRESKNGRTRLVPLHQSAMEPLRAYAQRRQKLFPFAEYFFVTERGTRFAKVDSTFCHLREGISYTRRPPRLQDFRHTFATHVLQRWQASPKGASNRILILSRFLGHARVECTYWYLAALPQMLAQAAQRFTLNEDNNS